MTGIKIIHAADLHLDSPFESLPIEVADVRREGQRQLLYKIAGLAEETGAKAILLAGDVFDGDAVSQKTLEAFQKAFGSAGVPVFVAPGNHDPYTPSSVWARMARPENVHIFKTEAFECVELDGIRIWGAGFEGIFAPSLLERFSAPTKRDGFDLMVLHGDLCSGTSDYNAVTRRQIAESGMDYIALGHIHSRTQILTEGKTAFAYCGCTEGRGYDELGEMGVYLLSLKDAGVSAQFVPLGGARYEIIKVDVSEKDAVSAINDAASSLSDKDYCRIILIGECEAPPDLAEIRRVFQGRFAQLQLRDETVQSRDVWAQTGQDSLAGLLLHKLRSQFEAAQSETEKSKIELAARYALAAIESGADR